VVDAARAGLQDSSPRSALLSLHARVEGIQPDAWRDPILAQVFGPRGAIYVVPRSDVGVFTLGLLPRSGDRMERINENARAVLEVGRCARHPLADVGYG